MRSFSSRDLLELPNAERVDSQKAANLAIGHACLPACFGLIGCGLGVNLRLRLARDAEPLVDDPGFHGGKAAERLVQLLVRLSPLDLEVGLIMVGDPFLERSLFPRGAEDRIRAPLHKRGEANSGIAASTA